MLNAGTTLKSAEPCRSGYNVAHACGSNWLRSLPPQQKWGLIYLQLKWLQSLACLCHIRPGCTSQCTQSAARCLSLLGRKEATMSSRLTARSVAAASGSPARAFFLEVCCVHMQRARAMPSYKMALNAVSQVCRCLPFIQRLHKLDEVATLRELRAVVKNKFSEFKDVKDPRVRHWHSDGCISTRPRQPSDTNQPESSESGLKWN